MNDILNAEFTRADLEVTGAILRCEGRITDLRTGKVIDLQGLTVDEAVAELSVIDNDTFGIGWKHTDSMSLIPVNEAITVTGEAGEFVRFTCFMSVRFLRMWAGSESQTNKWERRRQAACANSQRRARLAQQYVH